MAWIELKIESHDASQTEALCDWLAEKALAVTVNDLYDDAIYEPEPGAQPMWEHALITALFDSNTDVMLVAAAMQNAFSDTLVSRISPLADQDWERAWLENFKPMQFGQRTWIVPSWYDEPDAPGVKIRLDPGLAFGTGTHATTRLCLEWLDSAELAGKTIVDYGCGSGILAIAAIKHGAQTAYCVDIDPQALTACQDNAAKNALSDNALHMTLPADMPTIKADVVIANILAKPLMQLAPTLADLCHPQGRLLLSGILPCQEDAVKTAYAPYFHQFTTREHDEWISIDAFRLG